MIRFTFILLFTTGLVYGFMIEQPRNSMRIRDNRAFVATAAPPPAVESAKKTILKTKPVGGKPKIDQLNAVDDYKNFLEEDDRLVMVKFFAPYCKSCQKFGQQYERIGKEIGELTARHMDGSQTVVREGEIRMAEMEFGANKELCKSLGVKKLPTVHFYSKGNLVDGFPCGPRKIGMLLEKLTKYRNMSPAELEFEADMNQGIALGETVLESLNLEVEESSTALSSR